MAISEHTALSIKISELHDAILTAHPQMPTLLRDIHQNLKLDPELTTLLTPEEVSIIVRGLSVQTQTTITTSILSKSKGKAASKMSVDDI